MASDWDSVLDHRHHRGNSSGVVDSVGLVRIPVEWLSRLLVVLSYVGIGSTCFAVGLSIGYYRSPSSGIEKAIKEAIEKSSQKHKVDIEYLRRSAGPISSSVGSG